MTYKVTAGGKSTMLILEPQAINYLTKIIDTNITLHLHVSA
jgi:hypothetical protein